MRANTILFFISDTFKSLKRNLTVSLASVATVAATLFIVGIFLLLMRNMNMGMDNIQSKIEVKAFLMDSVNETKRDNIAQQIKSIQGVKEISFESKEEALKKFNEQMSEKDRSLLSSYDSKNNPLPSSFIITLEKAELSEQVINSTKNIEGIESINNDKDYVDKILSISKAVKWIGAIIFVLMVAVSLFLIGNSIKLAVYSRRREIGIMKFVGATDWFIRWPFIIEGAVIGLIGAFVANIALYYTYNTVINKLTQSLMLVKVIAPSYVIGTMMWQFTLFGFFIGCFGSSWSLIKFLKV